MNSNIKTMIIILMFIISIFILDLMDNENIMALTIENNVSKTTRYTSNIESNTSLRLDIDKIEFSSKKANIISNIAKKDLKKLMKVKKEFLEIKNELGENCDFVVSNKTIYIGDFNFDSLLLYDGFKNYTIDYKDGYYELNYPRVSVGVGLSKTYFHNIEDAIKYSTNEVITLLNDITLDKTIELNKDITIDGNGFKLNSKDTLFTLNNKNITINISNVDIDTKRMIKVVKKNKSKLNIRDSKIIYEQLFTNKLKTNIKDTKISMYL